MIAPWIPAWHVKKTAVQGSTTHCLADARAEQTHRASLAVRGRGKSRAWPARNRSVARRVRAGQDHVEGAYYVNATTGLQPSS